MAVSLNIDVGALANAIVWPTFAAVLLVKYRHDIASFLRNLLKDVRLSKLSFGSLSAEFATTRGIEPNWGIGPADLRQTDVSNFGDYRSDLIAQIQDTSVIDYAIFDLGDGKQWLSSRLYLFVLIFHQMRGLRRIVFVNQRSGQHDFVGTADPREVRYALAIRYPWLEQTFAASYANLPGLRINTTHGSLDQDMAVLLIKNFLSNPVISFPGKQPLTFENEWTYLENSQRSEHAEWIDTQRLKDILQGILDTTWISRRDLEVKSKMDQAKLILSFKSQFVGVLDSNHRFEKLIDRNLILEELARSLLLD